MRSRALYCERASVRFALARYMVAAKHGALFSFNLKTHHFDFDFLEPTSKNHKGNAAYEYHQSCCLIFSTNQTCDKGYPE
jgi:hypothetical protein